MIIGISMGHETCLILGQVSLNLLYWKKNEGFLWFGVRLTSGLRHRNKFVNQIIML